ncbi:MAG TPA: redoxin domain-containing protein [Agriterribacter sp.]|nr:redoxin domain-containing protein [Agriterribacter sp.]
MKTKFLLIALFILNSFAFAQDGYQIHVTLKPFTGGYLYLGHHFGTKQYIIDSIPINNKSEAVFTGKEKLLGGIYMIIFPQKNGWFEMVIDQQQHFTVSADTADIIGKTHFVNSPDNDLFQSYQKMAQEKGKTVFALQKKLKDNPKDSDSSKIRSEITMLNKEMQQYREQFVKAHPAHLLSPIFMILQEPKVPDAAHQPGGKYDSAFAYQYYKQHYWDGVSFTDERLVRTPVFEPKLQRYFNNVLVQHPDSLSKAANFILDAASTNKEMFKFILSTLTEKYINPTYMGQDAVFVNLFERYYATGKADYWLNDKYRKAVFDRAYSVMANLIGEKAADMNMVDTAGKPTPLYSLQAPYIVVCFWDPTCGHCQTEVPKLDSVFQHKWKAQGVKIYGVMTDGGKEAWLNFIREHQIKGWSHVYQLPAVKDAEYNAGKPGYKQLYDVYQTPVLYLLDKDKNIIAKKLNYEQIDELLQVKMKQ